MKIMTIEARITDVGEGYLCLDKYFEIERLEDRRICSEIDLDSFGLNRGDKVRYHVLMGDEGGGYRINGEMIELLDSENGEKVVKSACSDGWKKGFKEKSSKE